MDKSWHNAWKYVQFINLSLWEIFQVEKRFQRSRSASLKTNLSFWLVQKILAQLSGGLDLHLVPNELSSSVETEKVKPEWDFHANCWPHLPPLYNNPNPIHYTVQNVPKSSFPCCVCGVAYAKLIVCAWFQVIDIKVKLRESKRFWSSLPDSICAEDTVTDPDEEQCWNSHTKGR